MWEQLGRHEKLEDLRTPNRVAHINKSDPAAITQQELAKERDVRLWGELWDGVRVHKGPALFPRLDLIPPADAKP
jgi:hypothetical protein